VIEIVSDDRCTRCNLCVKACPMDVFDLICEAHCPADALYVAPLRDPAPAGSPYLDEAGLIAEGVMGSYRARLGWGEGRTPPRTEEDAFALAGLTGS
jgi:NAD-dependent dihydropyrimidine dehydrogenase PreA subunit